MSRAWVIVGSTGAVVFAALAFVHPPAQVGVSPFDRYGKAVVHGQVPYRDFSLEYPPGALPPIVLPALVPGASYETAFRGLEALLGAALLACLAYLLRGVPVYELALRVGLVAVTPLLLGSVVFFRFDLWPALLVVASLVALDLDRPRLSAGLVGAATAAKLYAGVLLPPLAARTGRAGLAWALGVAAALTLPLSIAGPGGVAESFIRQLGRGVQIESSAGSAVALASVLGLGHPAVVFASGSWNVTGAGVTAIGVVVSSVGVALLAFVWLRLWRSRDGAWDPAVVYAGTVAIVLVATKVLSPQFLLWLVPLAVLVRGAAGAAASVLLAVAMVLTQLVYPDRYDALVALQREPVLLLAARNVVLLAAAATLVGAMLRALHGERVTEHEGGERDGEDLRGAVLLGSGQGDAPDRVPGVEPALERRGQHAREAEPGPAAPGLDGEPRSGGERR